MQSLKCSLSLFVALGLCHMCTAMPGRFVRGADDEALVTLQFEDNANDLNPINSEIPLKLFKPANTTLKVYPADTPIFDRTSVSLELPDRLFTNTFGTATNASKIIGNLIKNTARRFLYFSWFLKPLFGDALIVKDTRAIKLLNMTLTTTTTTTMKPELSTENDAIDEILTTEMGAVEENNDLDMTTIQSETSNETEDTDATTLEPETTTMEENSIETTMDDKNLAFNDASNEI